MISSFYLISILLVLSYSVTSVSYWLMFSKEQTESAMRSRILLFISLGLHSALIILIALMNKRYPFGTPGESLLVCAWMIGIAHVTSEFFAKSKPLGVFTLVPITVGVFFSILTIDPYTAISEEYLGSFFSFHIISSLTAYACFTIASILSCMYILLFKKLKSKQFDVFFRLLPPLENIELLMSIWVYFGIFFMILSPLIGRVWVIQNGAESGFSPKVLGIFVVLFLFIIASLGRTFSNFKGLRFAIFILVGFILLFLTQVLQIHGFN